METKLLKTFLTVANYSNFTKAAETLGYAQSSVTSHIHSLEENLGSKLFERLGKKVSLTKEGQLLLPYAEQIIKLIKEAQDVVKAGSETASGILTIGAVESLFVTRLPRLFEEYYKCHPKVELILDFGICSQHLQLLKSGALDVAFLLDRKINLPDFVSEVLMEEPMAILAAPHHPLTNKTSIGPLDLEGESLILTEKGCSYRGALESILAETHAHPRTIMEANSIQAIKQFTVCGFGVSLLPRTAVENEIAQGKLVEIPWTGPAFNIMTQLVYHRDKWISPTMESFLELARKLLKNSAT